MRKMMPYLGASIAALATAWSTPARAQDAFKDLDTNHWAYQAVTELQQKKILIGYPDGYFRGKRTLTRYEFAVALKRLLDSLPASGTGGVGPAGEPGRQGEVGPPGMTPEEVANLRRLTDEFKNDLAGLGANVRDLSKRVDDLAAQVAALNARLDRMPVITGNAFFGFRSDRSRYPFVDYSGAGRDYNPSHVSAVDAVHDFQLGIRANLPGGGKFTGEGVASNYLSYRTGGGGGGNLAFADGRAPGSFFQPGALALGGPSAANVNGLPETLSLYQARLDYPIAGVGSNTVLTLGRYKHQVTPLTYYRPDTDAYFDLPWYDDGNYVQDGGRLQTSFGSARTSIWAGSFSSLTTTTAGQFLNKPIAGASVGPRYFPSPDLLGRFAAGKPSGLAGLASGAIYANQVIGTHIAVPLGHFAEIGGTLIDLSVSKDGVPGLVQGPQANALPIGNVVIVGSDIKLNPIGKFTVNGEFSKSITQNSMDHGDRRNNDDNNAYQLNLGYLTGPLNIQAGYQYIDPRFAAPGYWNKIGNWYNPTNIRGPFFRLGYNVGGGLQFNIGGDYYEGARNRPGVAGNAGIGTGWGIGDNIYRGTVGAKYNISNRFNVSTNYEGVFYDLDRGHSATGRRSKPVEQYLTFGVGYNVTTNTVLKVAYQIINQQDVGSGFASATPGGTSNATVLTTQVAVHF